MVERDMVSAVDCNMSASEPTLIPWSYQTNWVVTHGSLQSSVAVESPDHPIDEPDPDFMPAQSPLTLKPPAPDSAPCEIKICFKQKYEVCQIYVRSSARAYEIYYATSPHGINEYLSTVRCGVAERDDKVLQTSCVEDVAKEHGECLSGDVIAETASSGESTNKSEDEWVKIKVSGAGTSPASDKISTDGSNNIQVLYEATAQINDLDPSLSLTIRLLSLQDKGCVYVDEIYVFVDSVQSTDSGNEAMLAGSSAQSSLMAMFMPNLLQLSKSGVSRAQDTHASDEVLKNGKVETTSTVIDRIDYSQQFLKPKELVKDTSESLLKPKERVKDTSESAELQQPKSAENCFETKNANSSQANHLETAMEQLTSRLSRVEDICLRFEEKMLKPIERIEARLQQIEHQLERLDKSSHVFGLPHGTRISAPEFSCRESNASSFDNDELEKKDFTGDDMSGLSREANFHPGLIIRAPEFSDGECDKDDDLEPLKDSPLKEPKKTLSVDDALAAALHGFCSTAINLSEPTQTPIGLLGDANADMQNEGPAESCQVVSSEVPAAENDNKETSQSAEVLTVKAPEFTAEETGSEEQLDFDRSTVDVASATEREKNDHSNEITPPSIENSSLFKSADSCSLVRNGSTNEFHSAFDGDSSAVTVVVNGTCVDVDEHLNRSSGVNMIETYFKGSVGPGEISSAKDSRDTCMHQISQETNLGKLTSQKPDDQIAGSEENFGHAVETVSEDLQQTVVVQSIEGDAEHVSEPSHFAFLDLEFPILEVTFASDVHTSTKSPLEALLDGAAEPNTEGPSIISKETDAASANGDETTYLVSTNSLLLDFDVSATDVSSHSEGASHSSAEIAESLI